MHIFAENCRELPLFAYPCIFLPLFAYPCIQNSPFFNQGSFAAAAVTNVKSEQVGGPKTGKERQSKYIVVQDDTVVPEYLQAIVFCANPAGFH